MQKYRVKDGPIDGPSKERWSARGSIEGYIELILNTSEKKVLTVATIMQDRPLREKQSFMGVHRGILRIIFYKIKNKGSDFVNNDAGRTVNFCLRDTLSPTLLYALANTSK